MAPNRTRGRHHGPHALRVRTYRTLDCRLPWLRDQKPCGSNARNNRWGSGASRGCRGSNRPRCRSSRHGLPGDSGSRNRAAFCSLRGFRWCLGWFSSLCVQGLRCSLGLLAGRFGSLLSLFQCLPGLLELGLRQACPFASHFNLFLCCGGHGAQVNIRLAAWFLGRLHSSVPDKLARASAADIALKARTQSQST